MIKTVLRVAALLNGLGALVALAVDPPERDLLFHVSFDRMSVRADYAAGSAAATDFQSDLEFRPQEGMNGKNAFCSRERRSSQSPKDARDSSGASDSRTRSSRECTTMS
ncbi:MAG: hypothetical protein KAI66_09420 [Lentisphaeria bacterium]|nr:hypothetical protein [Lentisphaeria bacterium]